MNILLATESYWPNADGGAVFELILPRQAPSETKTEK